MWAEGEEGSERLRAEAGGGQAEGRGGEGSTAHRSPGDCRGLGLPAWGEAEGPGQCESRKEGAHEGTRGAGWT